MKFLYLIFFSLWATTALMATGEPSTYFNIYLPPNNDAVQRNVSLVITAIQDSTVFIIQDDGADGDTDDSKSGVLMAGQSYILYIKDNGINDDATYASGGTLKRDGDYFIIHSDKLVYAFMATDSDWQHDFVPATNKSSVGQQFILYAPKVSSSNRDINAFAYEDNTTVSIYKVSTSTTLQTGYTNVDFEKKTLVTQKSINKGQDIIHFYNNGRNIMVPGETYLVESNKGISLQSGALYQNERDGGAYVPASNGSSTGELFYFAVPYQSTGEQEIRIVSWDDNNTVNLSRFSNGSWISMKDWNLNRLNPADWVGKQNNNASYATVFKVTCTAGKRVSVLEANWMETGSTNTSDMATMAASESGTTAGKDFLLYMLPPGKENTVINPFTGTLFGASMSHFYLFAGSKDATVTVKDAKTNGGVINRTYNIAAGRYADAYFTIDQWKSIYNGTGTTSGAERPYVLVQSNELISVAISNSNDNWLTYFGSSLPQSFTFEGMSTSTTVIPGDTATVSIDLNLSPNTVLENAEAKVTVSSGLLPLSCEIKNSTSNHTTEGEIEIGNDKSVISFPDLPDIHTNDDYNITTKVLVLPSYNNGDVLPNGSINAIETSISGEVNGEVQQALISTGLKNDSDNTSKLMFSSCGSGEMVNTLTDSWNGSWIDYNNDGRDDLFVTDKNEAANNQLFKQNSNGTFTQITTGQLVNTKAKTVGAIWGDINNDGYPDVFVINSTGKKSILHLNNGGNSFTELNNCGITTDPQYFQGAAFIDFNNDGFLDLFITNYFPTRFHELYRNNGDKTFTAINTSALTLESEQSLAPIASDYNNDGLVDIFIPNGDNRPNSLFKNLGGFQFEKITTGAIVTDAKNSVGAAWGDYNNDGFQDLFVANASDQDNDFYQNNGDGTFTRNDNTILTHDKGHSHGANWVDVDNDGDLDLYVTNDVGDKFLYMNEGNGNFSRKIGEVLGLDYGNSYGQAWSDYDKDGDLDVMVFTHGQENNRLFCNNSYRYKWLSIKLVGTHSNKSAIGAKVKIKSSGQWQTREILPVTGFGSQNSLRAHFGLNTSTTVDSIVVIWPSGFTQVITSNIVVNTYMTIVEESAHLLNGLAFNDLNNNGSKDENEPVIGNIQFKINPLNTILKSDNNGKFQVRVNSGNYSIAMISDPHWTCDGIGNISITNTTDSILVPIPLHAVQTGTDLALVFANTAWRRGFTNHTSLQVSNTGTSTAVNVNLTMNYPEHGILLSSDRDFTTAGSGVFQWHIDSLLPGETKNIMILDSISLNAYTGQVLQLSGAVTSATSETDASNNIYSLDIEVVGAIDPNEIVVSPKGEGPDGFIKKTQPLTYTVHFQNKGSYAATYVFIEDQLSQNLDLSTFKVVSASHNYNYQLSEDGFLKINFIDINLPFSDYNEAESHGFFTFQIQPKTLLSGLERIENKAEISFDFEAPIMTNTVVNSIQYSQAAQPLQLFLYPNPASTKVQISIDKEYYLYETAPEIQYYQILDINGKEVYVSPDIYLETTEANIAGLAKGIYLVKALDLKGLWHTNKLIIE